MLHPIFDKFRRVERTIPAGYVADFLGVITPISFYIDMLRNEDLEAITGLRTRRSDYPTVGEHLYEWIDLLESVVEAQDGFTFFELGAGYGRWMAIAAAAFRQIHGEKPLRLIGVEGEPTHFQWMKQHLSENGINPEDHQLVHAAVSDKSEKVLFTVGNPSGWYGQSAVKSADENPGIAVLEIQSITLNALLENVETVDLIDFDVQGAEGRVVQSSIHSLCAKVKRLHIGTHSRENESMLRETLFDHGWVNQSDFASNSTVTTEFGNIDFQDGVQSWVNSRLVASAKFKLDVNKICEQIVRLRDQVATLAMQMQPLEDKTKGLERELEIWKSQGKRIQKYIYEIERLVNPQARKQRSKSSSSSASEEEILQQMLKTLEKSKLIRLHRSLEKAKGKLKH